ncbi:MAG: SusD/RagB family nutrient-binding outer membrane lipoprotein [Ginsengibacter sp.]
MKHLKVLFIILLLGTFWSCNKTFDRLLTDPNGPTPDAADVDAFLNQVQVSFNHFYAGTDPVTIGISDFGAELSRQQALINGSLYANARGPQDFDFVWETAYTGVVKHADALKPLALAQKKYQQAGIAQLLKAYTVATLVDFFGDVPYSEAGLGLENINPKTDAGKDTYVKILALIDSAIVNLNNPGQDKKALPKADLFYNGNISKWTAFANTLKLKLYMQERLVLPDAKAQITALETANNLIKTSSQDFQFTYGKNESSPDTRHIHYFNNYLGGGAGDYIGNQFLYTTIFKKNGNANVDPRRRYYFYRQVSDYSDANSQTAQCVTQARPAWYIAGMPFCLDDIGAGYWGRDHGDASGVGPDNLDRTTWGLYPAGGKFDESTFEKLDATGKGAGGKGIDPIWLSSFTYFLQAEAALPSTLNVTVNGDAKTLLEKGIRESIAKVIGFPTQIGYAVDPARVPTQATIDNYVTVVLGTYDGATTDDERLNIIMEEYYIALWGNGIEPYNNLRRTGKPADLQYIVTTANPGFFIRSEFYPAVFVNANINAPVQKTPGTGVQKVFWDTNPDNFIK